MSEMPLIAENMFTTTTTEHEENVVTTTGTTIEHKEKMFTRNDIQASKASKYTVMPMFLTGCETEMHMGKQLRVNCFDLCKGSYFTCMKITKSDVIWRTVSKGRIWYVKIIVLLF